MRILADISAQYQNTTSSIHLRQSQPVSVSLLDSQIASFFTQSHMLIAAQDETLRFSDLTTNQQGISGEISKQCAFPRKSNPLSMLIK